MYVVFGSSLGPSGVQNNLALLNGSNGFSISVIFSNSDLSPDYEYVACAGDINNDGAKDVLIGTSSHGSGNISISAVYLIFGRVPASGPFPSAINASTMAAGTGFKIYKSE
jgi:hypothetical protein